MKLTIENQLYYKDVELIVSYKDQKDPMKHLEKDQKDPEKDQEKDQKDQEKDQKDLKTQPKDHLSMKLLTKSLKLSMLTTTELLTKMKLMPDLKN